MAGSFSSFLLLGRLSTVVEIATLYQVQTGRIVSTNIHLTEHSVHCLSLIGAMTFLMSMHLVNDVQTNKRTN